MNLLQLQHVLAICEEGGFSAAARKLGVSQPTLSRSVARLEADLSLKLFHRDRRAARPTEHGAYIAKRAQDLLLGARALDHELEDLARGEEGLLRIGVGPAARLKPLPQLLRRLHQRFPRLRIEVTQQSGHTIMRSAQDGRFDIVLGFSVCAEDYADLMRVHLFEDRIVAVVRAGHPLAGVVPSGHELLSFPMAHPMISDPSEPLPPPSWARRATRAQLNNFRAFVCDDMLLIKERALTSDFIAFGPGFLFEEECASGALVEVPLRANGVYKSWLLTRPERWRSPIVKAVADIAKSVCSETPAPLPTDHSRNA